MPTLLFWLFALIMLLGGLAVVPADHEIQEELEKLQDLLRGGRED